MFDTIAGLPIHPLAVHAVVVLLPLMALVTMAVAVRPVWRRHAKLVIGANALVLVAAFVARQSGQALYARIGQFGRNDLAEKHVGYGNVLPLFALGLLVASGLILLTTSRPKLAPVVVGLSVVAGVAAVGWTVVTGDSGARAVWETVIANTTG